MSPSEKSLGRESDKENGFVNWIELKWRKFIYLIPFYWEAIKWTAALSILLFLPTILSVIYDTFLLIGCNDIPSVGGSILGKIDHLLRDGSFLIITLGLSGSAIIEYYFEYKVNLWESIIYLLFTFIVVMTVLLYSMIYFVSLGDEISVDLDLLTLDWDSVEFWSKTLFFISLFYCIGVKGIVLEHRKRLEERNI